MRVLVTRPAPGASRTAARLEAAGHDPIVLPLTATTGIAVKAAELPQCDAIAVTSANALRFAPRVLLSGLADRPVFAVGAETAGQARDSGFGEVIEGPGGGLGLAALIRSRAGTGATILYLCGRVRHPAFELAVREQGVSVIAVETYDVSRVSYPDADVLIRIGSQVVDAVLLYSAVAAAAYRDLCARPSIASALGAPLVACLSQRIASALGAEAPGVRVATAPTESALLALLDP